MKPGCPGQKHPFRIEKIFQSESTADVGRANLEIVSINAENIVGQLIPEGVESLCCAGQGIGVALDVIFTDAGARLHRHGRDTIVDDIQFHDVLGLGEGVV